MSFDGQEKNIRKCHLSVYIDLMPFPVNLFDTLDHIMGYEIMCSGHIDEHTVQ